MKAIWLNTMVLGIVIVSGGPRATGDDKPAAAAASRTAPDYTHALRIFPEAELPLRRPQVLWKFLSETENRPDGTSRMVPVTAPAYADGHVYFADDKGRVFALDANDGTELWCHEHGSRIHLTPHIDRDHLYFGSEWGVGAVRREDGKQVWFHTVEHGANSPLPIGDRVFASGNNGWSYALDRATGKILWKHDFGADAPDDRDGHAARARFQKIVARPAGSASDGKLFIQCIFDQSRVIALDAMTGERRWTFDRRHWVSGTPTIAGERVYFSCQDSFFYCLHLRTGKLIWQYKTPGWFTTQGTIHAGDVFVTHHKGRMYQLNAESGELRETLQLPELKDSLEVDPLVAKLTQYFKTKDGFVIAGDLATDGRHIFLHSNQDLKDMGEASIIAIGEKE